jgi:hypothetical protein
MRSKALTLCLILASVALTGCDALGIETAPKIAAKKDAEAHAIGSACRHAVRSIEDCFRSNPKSVKAAMFNGWKEMDAYMRENEILGMPSTIVEPAASGAASGHSSQDPASEGDAHTGGSQKS